MTSDALPTPTAQLQVRNVVVNDEAAESRRRLASQRLKVQSLSAPSVSEEMATPFVDEHLTVEQPKRHWRPILLSLGLSLMVLGLGAMIIARELF